MNFELLVPICLFAAIAYSIKAVVDARVRKQLVASNGAPDLVRSILEGVAQAVAGDRGRWRRAVRHDRCAARAACAYF